MKYPSFLICVVLLGFWVTTLNSAIAGSCKGCHKDIEPISDVDEMKALECSFCHRGHPEKDKKEEAHYSMWANPSDYNVAQNTCGQCHEDILFRSKKSLHATSAGIISATRYLFCAQETKNAIYAVKDVADRDGQVPERQGALLALRELPFYNPERPESHLNSPADDYLREQCLRCHLYSYGAERFGDYRSSGCAACHMIYDDDGTYKGHDQAIRGVSKGPLPSPRPRIHKLTTKIPPLQCIHCHNRGGRTGVSFIGTMESDGYGSPWSKEPGKKAAKKIHGKYYNHLEPDIHYKKGLSCVDCHTEKDVHGDGNIYSKKEQAVEIECQDCHGSVSRKSMLKTQKGTAIKSLKMINGKVFLDSVSGRRYEVPQVVDVVLRSKKARIAMSIRAHMEKMECYSCHSRWAPQCYGCHAQQDTSTKSFDWVKGKGAQDPSLAGKRAYRAKTAYKWRETRSYLRWENPSLGINSEGKVSPFIPGCQVIFTQIGPDGRCRVHNKVYVTRDGIDAIATNPIQPHTVSRQARSCESCHASKKALGLGEGIYITRANGIGLDFGLDRIVDEKGRQLQATSHVGARPFNEKEQKRITRVGTCAACHGWGDSAMFERMPSLNGTIDNEAHKSILHNLIYKH